MGDQINNPAEQNFASVEVVGLQGLQPVQMTPAELAIVEAFEFLTAEDLSGREIRVLAGVHPDHIVHSVDQKLWGLIIQALVPDSVESAPKVRRRICTRDWSNHTFENTRTLCICCTG